MATILADTASIIFARHTDAEDHREGFRTLLVGGEYSSLGHMGRLITSSITGSVLLIGIFHRHGFVFSRSLRTGLAMLVILAIIPVVVRGYIAYLGMPLDFITASAANLDLGMTKGTHTQIEGKIHTREYARLQQEKRSQEIDLRDPHPGSGQIRPLPQRRSGRGAGAAA